MSLGDKRITGIRILMVVSQLLLLVFLTKWLMVQYQSEKEVLRKDLSQQYIRAVDDATDSLVLGRLINPILKEELEAARKAGRDTSYQIRIHTPGKVELRSHNVERTVFTSSTSDTRRFIRVSKNRDVNIVDTLYDVKDTMFRVPDMKKMVRGVRVLINEMNVDSSGPMLIDDTILLKNFVDRMKKSEYPFRIQKTTAANEEKAIVLSRALPGQAALAVTGYNGYLYKRILPDIFFAFLLFSITATAFFTMYRSFRAQQRLSLMKNDLVSNMTHELKTPIATVKVALEALDSFHVINDPKTTKEYLQMAVSEMNRLELLVSQALNTSLLETGKMELELETADVADLTKHTVDALQLKFLQKLATVNVFTEGEHFSARIDKLHFQGVLINLLDNSLKYGGDKTIVTVIVREEGPNITVAVSDNGPGIPVRYQEKVFDKFFRVPTGNVHDVGGYGLGLSYAKQVMEQHKGSIIVRNNEAGGCSFVLTLKKADA
jgi:signal transduction histidine kinase